MRGCRALASGDGVVAGALIAVLEHSSRAGAAPDRDCSDFANQAKAQHYFTTHGGSKSNDFDNLDGDGDDRVWESFIYWDSVRPRSERAHGMRSPGLWKSNTRRPKAPLLEAVGPGSKFQVVF